VVKKIKSRVNQKMRRIKKQPKGEWINSQNKKMKATG
jgi:hypothetical protein